MKISFASLDACKSLSSSIVPWSSAPGSLSQTQSNVRAQEALPGLCARGRSSNELLHDVQPPRRSGTNAAHRGCPCVRLSFPGRKSVRSTIFGRFEAMVAANAAMPRRASTLFSVAIHQAGYDDQASTHLDMGELSRDATRTYTLKICHHGKRRLGLRCSLEGLPFMALKFGGRPLVPGLTRTIEVTVDARQEAPPQEWCGVIRIHGAEVLPGAMTASVEVAARDEVTIPVYAKIAVLPRPGGQGGAGARASEGWETPRSTLGSRMTTPRQSVAHVSSQGHVGACATARPTSASTGPVR